MPQDDQTDSADRIQAELELHSRAPFRRELAELLTYPPSPEALRKFAEKSPDRRGQLLAILGRLSGYHEKVEISASVAVRVQQMSDAELAIEAARLVARFLEITQGKGTKDQAPKSLNG